jgi:hypothetical protein
MRKTIAGILSVALFLVLTLLVATPALGQSGFDQYGYNDTARVFVGTAWDWGYARGWVDDEITAYFGPYVNDKIVMKWNAEWDRGNNENWDNPPYKAWTNNEWNGMNGGSGAVWHYKIVWVGDYNADPSVIPDGAYGIWGEFAVIMDQGIDPNIEPGHIWFSHASPAGYGKY